MKSCTFLLVSILVLLSSAATAQIDTTDFFPMQIGNHWEYFLTTLTGTPGSLEIAVTGDTVLNGQHYIRFNKKYSDKYGEFSSRISYYRKDSNAVYLFWQADYCPEGEYKIFDLTPGLKDSTVWKTCRPNYERGSLGRGVHVWQGNGYINWVEQPGELRDFRDVAISQKDTAWWTGDGQSSITLLKGFGIVQENWFTVGTYYLKGATINSKTFGKLTSVENGKSIIPGSMTIQAYPNPFNPTTTISYSIPKASPVELKVFDMLGREIQTLVSKEQSAGEYNIKFDASSLPSGMYVYSIQAGELRVSKKMLLLK